MNNSGAYLSNRTSGISSFVSPCTDLSPKEIAKEDKDECKTYIICKHKFIKLIVTL